MLQAYLVAKPFNLPPAALKQEPDFRRTILTKAIPQLLASQEDPTTEIVDVVELATTKIVRLCKECLCNRFRPFSFFQHLSTLILQRRDLWAED
jgi:hypothetical protein